MFHGLALHTLIQYVLILVILCDRVMKRHKANQPLRPHDGRPPLLSPTFLADMAEEVEQRVLQQNGFEAKGNDLKDRLTAKMQERSDGRGHNPHFRVQPLCYAQHCLCGEYSCTAGESRLHVIVDL